MDPRNLPLVVAALLACALGAHLAPLLLATAIVVIGGTAMILIGRISATVRRTGWGIFPVRYRVVRLTW